MTEAEKETKKKPEKAEKISQAEFEKRVKKLAESGLTSEKIGEKLKAEGIHSKEYEKKISEILGDAYENPDLKNVRAKLDRVGKHFLKNKQDKRAMRDKDRLVSEVRRLEKYHLSA